MARISNWFLGILLFSSLCYVSYGDTCSRRRAVWYTVSVCSHRCWWWCCGRRNVWRVYYTYDDYCCPGWKGYRCNTPICSPSCRNGGTCVRPYTCSCPGGYQGDICSGLSDCSYNKPCYPGRCYGGSGCSCTPGFTGRTCLELRSQKFKPLIERINSTFTYHSFTQKRDVYNYMADATNRTAGDIVWTNQNKFNQLEFDLEAYVDTPTVFPNNPSLPSYIMETKLGIVAASVKIIHEKLGKGGRHKAKEETLSCPGVSNGQPISDTHFKCYKKESYIIQFDSGDRYKLKYSITTGGYRKLRNTHTWSYVRTETYSGISEENSMEFWFDYDEPNHCTEDSSCTSNESPLQLQEDITKSPISPKWSGWIDKLSGIEKYVIEIWKMEYSIDYSGLREPDITTNVNPVPDYITVVLPENPIKFPTYEPKDPGVYSVIIEVNDRANNSKYARRFVIYDNTSEITTSEIDRLYATSASNESHFSWMTKFIPQMNVSWTNHFLNDVHEKGHFLTKILDYTPRLSDNITRVDYKKILPKFDDYEGVRNKTAIKNINSIVRFETRHGKVSTEIPQIGWVPVLPLRENFTFRLDGIDIEDGDSHQFWVRAFDIMGNTKVDSTIVNFDYSAPFVYPPKISLNLKDGKYPFSSSVVVSAKDVHSGIKKVSFKFKVNETEEIRSEHTFDIQTKTRDYCDTQPKECYCVRMGDCFMIDTQLEINNCWMKVPIDSIGNDVYVLEITVFNSAMLQSSITKEIGMVKEVNGVQDYFSPSNITVLKATGTSVSIQWIQAPTCYERAGISIVLVRPDNSTKVFKVHKEATTFDLTGLSPTTSYWFNMTTNYGNDTHFVSSSVPTKFSFVTTEEEVGLSAGGVGGLVAGFLIILIVVIAVLVFLGRTGRLQPAKQQVTAGIRTIRNTIRVRGTSSGLNNRAFISKEDDDIYFYGGMDTKGEKSWALSRKDISLESELTRGRFAIIYLAQYYTHQEAKTVIAKSLKDDQNEENVVKMRAKINFYATKVGHHKNILDFIGSVEDDVRGPMMILEYCSKGVLKEFLESARSNITVELEERLFRMAFGICNGMDYLASNKVVHRRLAARNVLLNDLHEPKLTGFGPDPDANQDEDAKNAERVPVKWMAPECMKTTAYANELSDVWSYGIVMWEIFSLGETPYPGVQSRDVPGMVKRGYKMKKPEHCDDVFYKIMLKCWHYDPRKRAGFSQIKEELNNLFTEAPGDDYYYRTNEL
ncbi:uncharacterized protein [Mytilus edulis]|uniref:uncharacterized protein isoform X2 n=1 Tax=Mytilus edulis TaxID=6550 RepID=UPI0039EFF137